MVVSGMCRGGDACEARTSFVFGQQSPAQRRILRGYGAAVAADVHTHLKTIPAQITAMIEAHQSGPDASAIQVR